MTLFNNKLLLLFLLFIGSFCCHSHALSSSSSSSYSSTITTTTCSSSDVCDYLIVGGGATGMAFADTLLEHYPKNDAHDDDDDATNQNRKGPSVIMVDKHPSPGGQWHDSYAFVRLHQPSAMYGVETEKLEPTTTDDDGNGNDSSSSSSSHRATRKEILEYYDRVRQKLESQYDFRFLGGRTFDFEQLRKKTQENGRNDDDDDDVECSIHSSDNNNNNSPSTIRVRKRIVDARYLEPDLPIFVEPKFSYNPEAIKCVPVNSLVDDDDNNENDDGSGPLTTSSKKNHYYVVIGAGKTGMDAITYLQMERHVPSDNIMWVVPNEAWITARENIGSCMEFLHTCSLLAKDKQQQSGKTPNTMNELVESADFLQDGFLEWERQGKVYRFHEDIMPTKFKDATLSQRELDSIKNVKRIARNGRVEEITDKGELKFVDGTVTKLPWDVKDTTFVHCSAGAFHYSKQIGINTPPIFDSKRLIIQDVYGTPGFCFVGSILGLLECLDCRLSDADKNAMLLAPLRSANDDSIIKSKLGPSGGDVGVVSSDHGYVQRVTNLRNWLRQPEIREFLVGHRLFNLGQYSIDKMDAIVEEIWDVLAEGGLVPTEGA